MEIARQLTWCETRGDQFHYRTRDGDEVDIVLENLLGEVVAIEVKASATPTPDDFRGIRHLHDRIGDDLVAGYVLHTGQRTLPFGPKYRAVPVSALWEVPAATSVGDDVPRRHRALRHRRRRRRQRRDE
ncbi:DUF4143 domain-containing protein [Myceligenerans indicum]|uniref:DUF4143 domain-containing protein n=1 Tax=Myceligenerans indicum TaxID=2593663 RepID=UPI00191E2C8B